MAVVPGNSLRPQDYPVRRIPISTLCYGYAPFPVTAIRSTLTFVSTVAGPFVFEPPSRDLSRITSTRILRCLVLAESEGDPPRTNERTNEDCDRETRPSRMEIERSRFAHVDVCDVCCRMHVSTEMGGHLVPERSQTADRDLQE